MLGKDILEQQLNYTLKGTNFSFGKRHEGKVRDSYVFGDKRLIITTDRISAFDRVLCTLPFKGQVLNQTASFWFEKTKNIIPNHVISLPDPNALLAKECELIPIEMIVRGYLTGSTKTSVLYNYENGVRDYCGNKLPDNMVKNQKFDQPIITPTTKGEKDELISGTEAVNQGLVSQEHWDIMADAALKLFNFGVEHVAKNNLILVDTKYEFGLLDGKVVVIDEIHTPDSSRFWIKDTYEERMKKGEDPQKLDKEYVRQHLAQQGFLGDGQIPEISNEVKIEAASRYIKAYEMITGQQFEAQPGNVDERLLKNLRDAKIISG